jgi:hypothetical protein
VTEIIEPSGGSLTSYNGDTLLEFPPGAFAAAVFVSHVRAPGAPPGGKLASTGDEYKLTAVFSDTGGPAMLEPGHWYTVTVEYGDAAARHMDESTLALYHWDGGAWIKEPTSEVHLGNNTVTGYPDHFSNWAVLGETNRVYLPLVLRQ